MRADRAVGDVVADAEMVGPIRGEVWLTDLSPDRGHEQAGRRPVLIGGRAEGQELGPPRRRNYPELPKIVN